MIALTLVMCPVVAQAQASQVTNPYGRDVEFTVALRDRQNIVGELPLFMSKEGALSVSVSALSAVLASRITAQAQQTLLTLATSEGRTRFEALRALGYVLTFNDSELEVSISIPLSARLSRDYSVLGPQRTEVGDYDPVAPFSFVANVRLNGDYVRGDFGDNFTGSGTLNLVGRVKKVAYQSNYRFSADRAALFHDGTRFIIDDVTRALRWQIGDIRPFSASPVGGEDVLGIGFSRETDILQPDFIARVRGTQTFSIEETSEVTVSVNGRVVTRRTFAPGNYNIADFPFVLGRNQIELLIKNQAGQEERLSFNQFLDSRLLEAGRDDFGIAIGVASRAGFNIGRQYDARKWVLNAHYIRGLSEKLTLGLATTASQSAGAMLATGVFASDMGVISGRVGLNYAPNNTLVGIAGIGLVRTFTRSASLESSRSFRFGLDGRFANSGRNANTFNASVGYAWPLTRNMTASVDLRTAGNNGSASFQTSYGLARDLRLDIALDWRFNKNKDLAGPGVSISLSRRFGQSGQGRLRYDSWLRESRASYNHTPNIGLGQWAHSLEAASSGNGVSVASAHSALFNRLEVATSLNSVWNDGRTSQRVSVRTGSALAFAGGKWAFGRPVSDSFAIIAGHRSLKGHVISLASRGYDAGPMAKTGLLGPALVTGLGTYTSRVVNVEVDNPPEGYDLGSGTYRVRPPLFGGYAFVVGSERSLSIVGRLLLNNGKPAALVAGSATSPDWPQSAPVIVFTNAEGRFSLTGLARGRWSIKMRGIEGNFDFVVGAPDTRYLDIGDIRVGPGS